MAKKMLSLLLALMMLYSLAVPAWAEATQTETPAPTETTAPTEEPTPTETPVQTEEPAPTETPVQTEEPVPTETPDTTEEPVQTEKPVEEMENVDDAAVMAAAADQTVASDETQYLIVNLEDNTGENISITQVDGTLFVSGNKVPMQPSGNYELYLEAQGDSEAYYLVIASGAFRFDPVDTGRLKLTLFDLDQDGQVTATLIKKVRLHLVGDGIAYVSEAVQEGPEYNSYQEGALIRPDRPLYAAVKEGYALAVEGAAAEPDTGFYGGGYYVDNAGAVTRIYRVN